MLAILGDIHGDFFILGESAKKAADNGATALIQVGDFGYYPRMLHKLRQLTLALPVYWIDGNHEMHELFLDGGESKTHENCFFVPRGKVMMLDNRQIVFMGGASSVDKQTRLNYGMHWSALENIRPQDMARMTSELAHVNNKVDLFISHVPPQSVIQKNFDPRVLRDFFGLPITWQDPDADLIESIWNGIGNVPMYCGHMHRALVDNNCTILNTNQLIYV